MATKIKRLLPKVPHPKKTVGLLPDADPEFTRDEPLSHRRHVSWAWGRVAIRARKKAMAKKLATKKASSGRKSTRRF
jgi:hypothetical protein